MKPSFIPALNRILKHEYEKSNAPITEFQKVRGGRVFKILVATILSARTKDKTTAEVSARLFNVVKKPSDFARLSRSALEKLLFPVGFYRTKAKHLKQLPERLETLFGGTIPGNIEDLCKLPGVGRKTASLVVAEGFNKPAICVDVHVHRISNRLGLVRTTTPLETEKRLRKILPIRYWKTWNSYLVSYGQTVCLPIRPKCRQCPIRRYCRRVDVRSGNIAP